MARIGLNTTISGLTGFLIIRWVKASAPLAEVGRLPAAGFPYNAVDNLTGLDPVVYIVQWWRSDDGVALDQLIKDWAIDASIYNETTIRTYQYVTDRGDGDSGVWADPVNGDTILVDTRLNGATKDELLVHEAGYGNIIDANYDLVPGGGIELLWGKQFDPGSQWFITRTQTVAVAIGSGGGDSAAKYAGVEVLAADRDFFIDSTDNLYNKLVIANWATPVGTITFPDLSLIPDNTKVTIVTETGAQNYVRLQFDAGDTVRFRNQDVNYIDLAKCEKIDLYFYDGVCYVDNYAGKALDRGKAFLDYSTTRDVDTGACLKAHEDTGVLDGADYPGLFDDIQALASGVVQLGAGVGQWSYDSGGGVYPNKRNFGIDLGAGTFRVPHLVGVSAKIGTTSGVYEKDDVYIDPATGLRAVKYTGTNTGTSFDNSGGEINNREGFTIQSDAAVFETRVKSFSQIAYIQL